MLLQYFYIQTKEKKEFKFLSFLILKVKHCQYLKMSFLQTNLIRDTSCPVENNGAGYHAINRHGKRIPFDTEAITDHLEDLKDRYEAVFYQTYRQKRVLNVDIASIISVISRRMYDDISTSDIDKIVAKYCAEQANPDYITFGGVVLAANYMKNCGTYYNGLSEWAKFAYNFRSGIVGSRSEKYSPLIRRVVKDVMVKYASFINNFIVHDRTLLFDYMSFYKLQSDYLLKGVIEGNRTAVEYPPYFYIRVAIEVCIAMHNKYGLDRYKFEPKSEEAFLADVKKTYELYSTFQFSMATPTNAKAGTPSPSLSSCYTNCFRDTKSEKLKKVPAGEYNDTVSDEDLARCSKEDSIEGIYEMLDFCASASKNGGGLGISFSSIRGTGALISGTNGMSSGLKSVHKVYNSAARHVNQGGNRPGAIASYLDVWHIDVVRWLELRNLKTGSIEDRSPDLHYGLMGNDLFFKRWALSELGKTKEPVMWSFFQPNECRDLLDLYGDEFEAKYLEYENDPNRIVTEENTWPMSKLVDAIMDATETSEPYILNKCAINLKSNHQNFGTVQNGNLCTEMVQFSDAKNPATCNLSSISLTQFVNRDTMKMDYDRLGEVVEFVTRITDAVIDANRFPTEATRNCAYRQRAIGIGVQGLASLFQIMGIPLDSEEAREINITIFETIYYHSVKASIDMAIKSGPYPGMTDNGGAPISKGLFQFDMWNNDFKYIINHEEGTLEKVPYVTRHSKTRTFDWDLQRERVLKYGIRNSMLLAPMPTATTALVFGQGNSEGIEAVQSNSYNRSVGKGEFVVMNVNLVRKLKELGLWKLKMTGQVDLNGNYEYDIPIRKHIVSNGGSILGISVGDDIEDEKERALLKQRYKDEVEAVFKTHPEYNLYKIGQLDRDRAPFICQSMSRNVMVKVSDSPREKLVADIIYNSLEGRLKTIRYYTYISNNDRTTAINMGDCSSCAL